MNKERTVVLRDKEIRSALRVHLEKRSPAPGKIIEELGVHNGNAKADLVAFYREMHCFEIKGETDSVRRVLKQSAFYVEAFPRLTLVTTENHITWAERNMPDFWGIMLAQPNQGKVSFKYIRKASGNPHVKPKKAFMMLWKEELKNIASSVSDVKIKSSYSREEIASAMSERIGKSDALFSIAKALVERSLYS